MSFFGSGALLAEPASNTGKVELAKTCGNYDRRGQLAAGAMWISALLGLSALAALLLLQPPADAAAARSLETSA